MGHMLASAGYGGQMPLTGEYKPSTSDWARKQAEAFEASDGAKANLLRGVPIIVMTNVGAKSGGCTRPRSCASSTTAATSSSRPRAVTRRPPAWYWNVVKHPHVELQDGPVKRDYLARELSGDERAEWWERAVEVWPDYDDYQKKTDRLIAVFLLEPIEG